LKPLLFFLGLASARSIAGMGFASAEEITAKTRAVNINTMIGSDLNRFCGY